MSERLDMYLVEHSLAQSRERAKLMIKNGLVTVNEKTVTKPSAAVTENDTVKAGGDLGYVGRGAIKLLKIFEKYDISVKGLVCADIGASTGGFTDVLLQKGAKKVYAVDVGHDQLHEKLKNDERVINMERTNVRNLPEDAFAEKIQFMCIDLSFISLKKVLKRLCSHLAEGANVVVLIKPQFEAGKEHIGKNGIVKDKDVHFEVLQDIAGLFYGCGLMLHETTYSPVKGGSGNIEYLALLRKEEPAPFITDFYKLIDLAFCVLKESKYEGLYHSKS